MSSFNAKKSRAKRPLPLWVDNTLRDAQMLGPDEFGAYIKLLMAMWSREDLTLPNNPTILARVAGVSLRLWNSRIGSAVLSCLCLVPDGVTSAYLTKEADNTERMVQRQSDRKNGKPSPKPLKSISQPASVVGSMDESTDDPSQHPNNPTNTLVANATNAARSGGLAEKGPLSQEKETNLNTAIWAEGVDLLSSCGVPEKQARSCIGKWLKDSEKLPLLQAIRAAVSAGTRDPIAYIAAILEKQKATPVSSLVAKALGGDGRA